MKPELKLKYAILDLAHIWEHGEKIRTNMTADEVEELWDESNDIYDAISETRSGGVITDLVAPYSRHYESQSVAVQCPTGEWVGFTYWYGGGKHGNPEEIDWIEHAYDVSCVEEEKVMTVRTFSKDESKQ